MEESEVWRRLEHKNIVRIFDSNERPYPYIAMEYMDVGSLRTLMKKHKFSVGESVNIIMHILNGLKYAHSMATVHSDIKPENILISTDGIPKISDWGISKFMVSPKKPSSDGISKTLLYSAPEQNDSDRFGEIDWRTDIFQLGILFYELVSGINPFDGNDDLEIVNNVITLNPDPPSSINPDVTPELDQIILNALEKEKEQRYGADVVLNKLKEITIQSGEKNK